MKMKMLQEAIRWLTGLLVKVLTKDRAVLDVPPCDFDKFLFELRLCDVILVEGRTRISDVIKTITLSCWTHSALYIGRLIDIKDKELRKLVMSFYRGSPDEHLIIESLLGDGTIISPMSKYRADNIRICRPKDLAPQDAQKVIDTAISYLGTKYATRHLLDLARFMFPYGFLPRRIRSTLFEHNPGRTTKTICSTMIGRSFAAAHYPIRPVIHRKNGNKLTWFRRNANLLTPKDFDYSPYFDIIKFPFMGDDMCVYRNLPWDKNGVVYNDEKECMNDNSNGNHKEKKDNHGILWHLLQKRET